MGKGRKKTPEPLKLLRGTSRKDRQNADAPDAVPESMRAPSWLPRGAVEHFGVLRARVEALGLDSATYTEALAIAAQRVYEIERLNAQIEAEGDTYKTIGVSGAECLKGHPGVAQRSEAMRHLQSILAEFGLTPASIQKVSVPGGKKKESKWAGL